MKQYPIWNIINSCAYKNRNKSYGIKEHGEIEVRIGTSSRNSYVFLETKTTHREHENGDREYRFYVDGKLIKRAILKKGADNVEVQGNISKALLEVAQ